MSSNNIKVSIIIRTKDRPEFLFRALCDIDAQTYENKEIIVVNDGGDTLNTEVFKSKFPSLNLTLINNATTLGLSVASDIGIKNAGGALIVIHDDDDTWHNDFLSKCVEFYIASVKIHPNVKGVVTHVTRINEVFENRSIRELDREDFNGKIDSINLFYMLGRNQFPPIAFVFSKEAYDFIGGFEDEYGMLCDDWRFNIKFLKQFDIALLKEHLAYYHVRKNQEPNTSASNTNRDLMRAVEFSTKNAKLREFLKIHPEFEGLTAFLSQYLTDIYKELKKDS